MKKIKAFFLMSLAVFLFACEEAGDSAPATGIVEFTFFPKSSANGRTAAVTLPDGATLRISITTTDGTVVHSLKELDLLKIGDGYFSEPLSLASGSYKITDCMPHPKPGRLWLVRCRIRCRSPSVFQKMKQSIRQ